MNCSLVGKLQEYWAVAVMVQFMRLSVTCSEKWKNPHRSGVFFDTRALAKSGVWRIIELLHAMERRKKERDI